MVKTGNIMVIGDSYSTFENYIPNGYAAWYFGYQVEYTDVDKVEQTWWYALAQETGGNILLNNSWSGSTVGNTGYDGVDATGSSFITRFDELAEKGFFQENTVDTLFIFGGTNDSWAGAPIGEVQYGAWERQDLFRVLPAFCYLLHRAKTVTPNTRVVVIWNTELNEELGKGFKTACAYYGVEIVVLESIGKTNDHPNMEGMRQIKEQILRAMEK